MNLYRNGHVHDGFTKALTTLESWYFLSQRRKASQDFGRQQKRRSKIGIRYLGSTSSTLMGPAKSQSSKLVYFCSLIHVSICFL